MSFCRQEFEKHITLCNNKDKITFQEVNDFLYHQIFVLGAFEKKMSSLSKSQRESVYQALECTDNMMQRIGFYEDELHNPMRQILMDTGLSNQEALAVMVAYHVSTPHDRKMLQSKITKGQFRDLSNGRSFQPDCPSFTDCQQDVECVNRIGQIIILEQKKLHHNGHRTEYPWKEHFSLFKQFQKMSQTQQQEVSDILEESIQISNQRGINIGISRMGGRLLSFFVRNSDTSFAKEHLNKLGKCKENMYVFSMLFLTQPDWHKERTILNINTQEKHMTGKGSWDKIMENMHSHPEYD